MKKPDKNLLKLHSLGYIRTIDVDYKQVSVDTARTYVTLTGLNGKSTHGLWSTYKDYLTLYVGHNHVAQIKPEFKKQLDDWFEFEQENKRELAEFERLKAKFGG